MRCLSVILLAVVSFAGCSEYGDFTEPSSTQPVTLPNGSMSASVNGKSWNADNAITATLMFGRLSLNGVDKHAWSVEVSTNKPAVGTQAFANPIDAYCSFSADNKKWDSRNTPASGQITFTTYTEHSAVGTFSCTGQGANSDTSGTGTVTNGTFSITY